MKIGFFGPSIQPGSVLGDFKNRTSLCTSIQEEIRKIVAAAPTANFYAADIWGVGSMALDICTAKQAIFTKIEVVVTDGKVVTPSTSEYVKRRQQLLKDKSDAILQLECPTKSSRVYLLAEMLHKNVDQLYCFYDLSDLPIATTTLFKKSEKVLFYTPGKDQLFNTPKAHYNDDSYWINI